MNALSFFPRHLQILFLQEIVFVCFYLFTVVLAEKIERIA